MPAYILDTDVISLLVEGREPVSSNYTRPAIARFDRLRKSKLNVGPMDLRIAAIALEEGGIVVTRNVRDFGRVPNLAVEDWTHPAAP